MIKYILIFFFLLSYQSFAQKVDTKEILHPKTDSVVNSWLKSNIKLAKKLKDNNLTLRYYYRLEDDTTLECRCGISEALFLLEKNKMAYKKIGGDSFLKSFPLAMYQKYGIKLSFEGCQAKTQTKCFNRVMDSLLIKKWGKNFDDIYDEVKEATLSDDGNNVVERSKFVVIADDLEKAVNKYFHCKIQETKKTSSLMGTIVIDNKGKLCIIDFLGTYETSRQTINFIKIYWQNLLKKYDFEKEIGKWCEINLYLKYDEKIKCE